MWNPDEALAALAAANRRIFNRPMAHAFGLTDKHLRVRLARNQIFRLHRGTFCAGPPVLDWHQQLLAATCAADVDARVSHRAALIVQGLDGIGSAPLEIKIPHEAEAQLAGVLVHRSRRNEVFEVRHGVKVTSLNQTLLDVASCCPPIVVEKALESAIRQGRISAASFESYLDLVGTKGCTGAKVIREILAERLPGGPAGSPAEVEFARIIRRLVAEGIEPPIRQFSIKLPDGSEAIPDAAWPMRVKAIEVDGQPTHDGMRDVDYDDERENQIREAGWDLRRYSARRVHRQPDAVFASALRFLGGEVARIGPLSRPEAGLGG